jgi:hypothetical protein
VIIPWLSEEACARAMRVGDDPDGYPAWVKLEVVADWLDAVDVACGQSGSQMQAFLRRLAQDLALEAAIEASEAGA